MAVRGINPLEKHVEKIFLALAAAGLTGVVAWQVAGSGGEVTLDGQKMPVDQAYQRIESKAKTLTAQMREPNPSTPEKLSQQIDVLGRFSAQLSGKVAPAPALAWAPQGARLEGVSAPGTRVDPDQFYLPPSLPAAIKPIAHPFMSTVHEAELAAAAGLAQYLPAKAPFDKAAVSVETTIDPKAIRAALEADPDGPSGKAQPLLRAWWASTEIVAVELVRQELKSDGTWGGEVATPVMPGRLSYTEQLKGQIDSQSLAQISQEAGANIDQILRPEWYRRAELSGSVVGEQWVSPSDAAEQSSAGTNVPLEREQRALRADRAEEARILKAIENAGRQPERPSSGGSGIGGGGGKLGGGGGGGGGRGPSGGGGSDAREAQLKDLQRRLEQVRKRIGEREAKIAELGGKTDAGAAKAIVKDADLSVLLSAAEPMTVWHHDVDAKRGATYRYQLRVKVSNPLYNRATQLREQDRAAAASATLTVPCAEWSEPVRVDDEVFCFFTGASAGGNVAGGSGLGSAQATMFYFTWGYWRSAVSNVEPGDTLSATWRVPDETAIASAPGAPAPDAPPPAPAAPGGGRRPAVAPGGGIAPPPGPAQPGQGAAPAAKLPTRDVTKERDAFLLDVVTNPAGERDSFLVLVREIDQSIAVRNPSQERESALFRRLEASAAAGRRQLAGEGGPAAPPAPGQGAPVPPMRPMPPGQGMPGLGGG